MIVWGGLTNSCEMKRSKKQRRKGKIYPFERRVPKTMDRCSWHCTGGNDKDHSHEKEVQKGKMIVWGGLKNSWWKKRSERQRRNGKIYPFKWESQRVTRTDKKAFFSNQCKEIEEKIRMGKTRDLFKKIRDTKGTFHAKLGSIKDRNMDEFICFCPPTIVEILRLQMVSRNHLLNHFHREDSSDSLKTIRIFLSRDRYRY